MNTLHLMEPASMRHTQVEASTAAQSYCKRRNQLYATVDKPACSLLCYIFPELHTLCTSIEGYQMYGAASFIVKMGLQSYPCGACKLYEGAVMELPKLAILNKCVT